MNPGAEPALRRGFQHEIAPVPARHVPRDREAEPDPAGREVARGVEPEEGAEDSNSQTAFEVRWSIKGPDIRDGSG